ncbi:lysylphosphatidylglycerol synthase transmembrane domain-containing protein [Guyparkeria sp. SCN-R1]|uniref:lysylphosphatidylglycerol synthase transmembrane domain-containing protein n=1 Tax=Guyparkeria sp. SCN-R1 TaxID=2341113 RepID=UPI00131597C5|nr:lysylphosphatidylglycerol synthase transmembrane domain-containing protein [Guyparkeria sp. SCN-R1]
MRSIKTRLLAIVSWAAVLLVLGLAIVWVGPERLIAPWRSIDPCALLVALVLMVASYLIRTLRITRYFPGRLAGHFWSAFRLSSWHNLMNNLLPMRSGELAFPVLMQRYYRLSPLESVPVLFWFRLLDLQVVLLIGLAAGGHLLGLSAGVLGLLFVLLLLAPVAAYALRHWLHGMLARRDGRLAKKGVTMLASLPDRPTRLLGTLFWTWANWLVKLAALGWVLAALAPVGFAAGVLGAIGGDLTTVLPVHAPGGFGTYEAGVALLLAPLVDEPRTVLAAAVNLHLFVLGTALLAAALALFIPRPSPR